MIGSELQTFLPIHCNWIHFLVFPRKLGLAPLQLRTLLANVFWITVCLLVQLLNKVTGAGVVQWRWEVEDLDAGNLTSLTTTHCKYYLCSQNYDNNTSLPNERCSVVWLVDPIIQRILCVKEGKERKSIYIAPFIYCVYLKALRHGSHSFTCKLITKTDHQFNT